MIYVLIFGMAAVTYLPRALPAVLIEKLHIGKKMQKFLRLIPYTAMAALIFPGVLGMDAERWYIGAAGGAAALVLSLFKLPVPVVILGAAALDFLLYLLL